MMSDREHVDPIDPIQMDRLVDGELSESQRRALLGRLDAEPDGWRRCALAFLEAQSWGEALGSLERDLAPEPARTSRPAAPPPLRRTLSRLRVLNWAAAVLVAFTLGWLVGGNRWQRDPRGDSIAEGPDAAAAGLVRDAPQRHDTAPLAEELQDASAPDHASGRGGDVVNALLATVRFPDAGDAAEVQVPVYDGPQFDERWVREQPPALPEYVLRQWQRRGYEVRQQRWLYPFQLEDGRQVVLPVDEVNVQFVGYEPF